MRHFGMVLLALTISLSAMAQSVGMSPFGYGKDVTGGGNATPTLVSTATELYNTMGGSKTSTTAKVIILTKSITVSSNSTLTFKKSSNKTIMALPDVTITTTGQTSGSSGAMYFRSCSNIILRNLTIIGPGAYDCGGEDLICFEGVTKAWVDHCDFQDGCDDNFDIKSTSDNITVSWCRFRYLKSPKAGGSGGADDHRFSDLLGSSSTDKPSDGTYNMTWAYCWWDNGCVERMLRCRNASLHFLNCYWNSDAANYYIGPENTDCYVEGCTFAGGSSSTMQKKSGRIFYQNYDGTNGVKFVNSVSTVKNNTTLSNVSNRTVVTPTYSYTALTAANAVTAVTNTTCGAGATLKVSTGGVVTSGCDGGEVTNTYTVTFNVNGHGTAPAAVTAAENTTISAPTAPTASGYTFGGWYKEAACTNAWNFSSDVVTANTTLYAKWTASSDPTPAGDACFSVTTPSTAPTVITDMVVSGGSISDNNSASKALTFDKNGIKFPGSAAQLALNLDNAITAGMTITFAYKNTSSSNPSGLALFDGNVANQIINVTGIAASASGTESYTFKTTDAHYIGQTKLIVTRNGQNGGLAISTITITGCGSTPTCTDPALSYATTEMEATMGDAAFTNALTNTDNLAITYTSSNTSVATVSTSGKVTLKGVGQTTITATAAEQTVSGKTYCEKAVSYNLTVNEATPTYTLDYNANGGSGTMASATYEQGDEVTILANGFTAPSGKLFNAWNTAALGTGTQYQPGDVFAINANTTLYALWKDKPAPSGDCSVSMFWCATADAAGKTQSEYITGITTGVKTTTGSLTIGDQTYTATAGAQISTSDSVSITIPQNHTANLYVSAASSSTTSRKLKLYDSSNNEVGSAETAASKTVAKEFSIDALEAGNYTLKTTGGGAILCLVGLQLCPNGSTAVEENANLPICKSAKLLQNGQLRILVNGQLYDATGRKL